MPCVAARVQDRPSGLVQMACGPTASQPPGPPASGRPDSRAEARRLPLPAPGPGARRRRRWRTRRTAAGPRRRWSASHGDDRVATGDDAVDGLEDAPLLLTGIHADGQRRRAVRCGVYLLAGGQRAELRAVAGQQGEGQDSHRDEDDDGDDDGGRSAAEQRVPGRGARSRAARVPAAWLRPRRAGSRARVRHRPGGELAAPGGRVHSGGAALGVRPPSGSGAVPGPGGCSACGPAGGRGSRLSVDRGAERHRQAVAGCRSRGCRSRGRPGAGPAVRARPRAAAAASGAAGRAAAAHAVAARSPAPVGIAAAAKVAVAAGIAARGRAAGRRSRGAAPTGFRTRSTGGARPATGTGQRSPSGSRAGRFGWNPGPPGLPRRARVGLTTGAAARTGRW